MIEHADVGVHPAVHVALERHHHFLRGEGVRHLHALDRLAVVELRVGLRHRVDVVQRRIAVDDLERLADADAEHVRMVAAVLLIDLRRIRSACRTRSCRGRPSRRRTRCRATCRRCRPCRFPATAGPCSRFTQTGSAFILIAAFFGAVPSSITDAGDVAGRRRCRPSGRAGVAAGADGSADVLCLLPPPHATTDAASVKPRVH